MKTKINCCSRF